MNCLKTGEVFEILDFSLYKKNTYKLIMGFIFNFYLLINCLFIRLHPAIASDECQYIGDWGDCDPFKMIRYIMVCWG